MILVALIARAFGGSRRAQVLAALTAALGGYLGAALRCRALALGVGGPRNRAPDLGPESCMAGNKRLAQLAMARAIAGYGAENRAQILPLLWLFTGPLLFPVSAAGVAWVLWTKAGAPWRAIGIAAIVALVLVVVSGGKG